MIAAGCGPHEALIGHERKAAPLSGAATRRSAQGREGSRNDKHVLLLDHHARPAARRGRPDPFGAGLFADAEAVGGVLVGPDVAPFVEPAELRMPSADERRELDALGDVTAPAVDDPGDAAGLESVDADFIEVAELARLERRREGCGEIDVALQLDLELPHIGGPAPGALSPLRAAGCGRRDR